MLPAYACVFCFRLCWFHKWTKGFPSSLIRRAFFSSGFLQKAASLCRGRQDVFYTIVFFFFVAIRAADAGDLSIKRPFRAFNGNPKNYKTPGERCFIAVYEALNEKGRIRRLFWDLRKPLFALYITPNLIFFQADILRGKSMKLQILRLWEWKGYWSGSYSHLRSFPAGCRCLTARGKTEPPNWQCSWRPI